MQYMYIVHVVPAALLLESWRTGLMMPHALELLASERGDAQCCARMDLVSPLRDIYHLGKRDVRLCHDSLGFAGGPLYLAGLVFRPPAHASERQEMLSDGSTVNSSEGRGSKPSKP